MEEVPPKTDKNYYKTNPDKFKKLSKRYYEERGGKKLKQDYYKANKQMLIERSKARYQANKKQILETKRLKLIAKKLSEDKLKEEEHGSEPSDDELNKSTSK
tara:strand:- start:1599 stop:1904 length:306 start_codon:yes stop_codon:yes gene_type:complete